MLTKLFSFLISSLLLPLCSLWAQNYNFTNYNLKEGLPQSQVSTIFQAKDRTLWLGSFGGVSNFDGLTFTSYSKADGMLSNNVNCIIEDRHNKVWVGTDNGINIIQNGKVKRIIEGLDVYSLVQDKAGNIWGLANRQLFKLEHQKIKFINVVEGEQVTCLSSDAKGNLYAFVRRTGVFKLNKNVWQAHTVLPAGLANNYVTKLFFDILDPDKFYLTTIKNGVFSVVNGEVNQLFYDKNIDGYFDIAQDNRQNIWIATQKGAYMLNASTGNVTIFNEQNGLRANKVNVVFKDVEGNIWLSSFGDGIFRYEGDAFIKYDKFKGRDLSYPISGMAVDRNQNLWVSTFNKGLYLFDGENITQPEANKIENKYIYFVAADRDKNILLSVQNNGLWRYNGKGFSQMPFTRGANISAVVQDELRNFYIGEINSVSFLEKNTVKRIVGFKGWVSCLFHHRKDSVFLGTSTGVYLIKNQKIDHRFNIKELENAYVIGITKHRNLLLFFTLGDGIISFDLQTKRIVRYTMSSGLNSNDIYSIGIDKNNILWAGTGRGINKLKFDKASNRYRVIKGNSPIVEANQNVVVNYRGDILIGTTTGILRCNTTLFKEKHVAPSISLKEMNVFDKTANEKDTTIHFSGKNAAPIVLKHTQNHISIDYKGVSLTNPQFVLYRYCLVGIDRDFGKAVALTEAEYSALSPGTYTFKVYAEVNGEKSGETKVTFIITPPFYATLWFKVLVFTLLILFIWLLIFLILKRKEFIRRRLEKIKLEEQSKIRKQTAEDFHDDIGNKLTRINVLSEILNKKIDDKQAEQKELIRMIKENAGFLYTGTKDVLWALDPKSDNLYEIMQHIREFGYDLFQNTNVQFKMDDFPEAYKKWHMSMEQNRNITLIFKEILTNILKHANAKNIVVKIINGAQDGVKISVWDDGKGFDPENIKGGHGLQNIQNRCKRIAATLHINTASGKGTTILISDIKPIKK